MTFIATKLFHKAGEGSGGGGGGGDQHNLGWYATESALTTAHPTATAGDWAIVGSTDTVWLWDTDNEEWVDSDQKGQVTSVNGQTGDVVLDLLPSQTGQSGKFLTTDGTDASWAAVNALQNTATGTNALAILGSTAAGWSVVLGASASSTGDSSVVIGYNAKITGNYSYKSVCIGYGATVTSDSCVCIGRSASASYSGDVVIGEQAKVTGVSNSAISIGKGATASAQEAYAIGAGATATATGAIQIGRGTNNVPYTMRVNTNLYDLSKNVELLSADGTIPEARLADTTNAQQGDVLTLDANGDAVWQAGSGGSGLPDQTGNAGKFLTTDGTDASWSDKPLINQLAGGTGSVGIKTYVYNNDCVAINSDTVLGANGVTLIGKNAFANDSNHYAVGIGYGARINAPNAILINASGTNQYNRTANTFKIGNTNGVFEMMDANGNLPADRLASTTGLTDGNYRLRLTMTDGVPSLSWVAE